MKYIMLTAFNDFFTRGPISIDWKVEGYPPFWQMPIQQHFEPWVSKSPEGLAMKKLHVLAFKFTGNLIRRAGYGEVAIYELDNKSLIGLE